MTGVIMLFNLSSSLCLIVSNKNCENGLHSGQLEGIKDFPRFKIYYSFPKDVRYAYIYI